jgi:hypothetical protein
VALLKSHTPDLDVEKLWRDFLFDNDEERDALVDMIPLDIMCPTMTSLYSMSQMTMVALAFRPSCNIFSARCKKLVLIYKLV